MAGHFTHGLLLSAATGELIAQDILGEKPTLEVGSFRPGPQTPRFGGSLVLEGAILKAPFRLGLYNKRSFYEHSLLKGGSLVSSLGAYGFIGARLAHQLLAQGQKDLLLADKADYALARSCVKGLESLPFLDREILLAKLPELSGVSAVIHLGACTDTGNHDQAYMWRMNTDYTKALWQWCAQKRIPLIYASSGATYGRGEEGYSDDHAELPKYHPLNVYGRSKHEFDLWALEQKGRATPCWYGLKFFNVYGMDENHKARMASPIFHGFHEIKKTGKQTLFQLLAQRSRVRDGEQKTRISSLWTTLYRFVFFVWSRQRRLNL